MRVVVADDAILFRKVVAEVLSSLPGVEVVGLAPNGKLALQRVRELKPDLLTLDMNMPEMDGLAVLDALKNIPDRPAVIVVSAATLHGGRLTLQALQKGAFDFITKPDAATAEQSREVLRTELAARVKALALRQGIRSILGGAAASAASVASAASAASAPSAPTTPPLRSAAASAASADSAPGAAGMNDIGSRMARLAGKTRPELVLIGVSTGGPNALAALLPALPGNLGVPVLIVQHMPPIFTRSLAESLDSKCSLRVREAAEGDILQADTVYIAPGGRQMRIAPGPGGGKLIQITDDPPENNCRPAADYLFRSAATHFPGRSVGVILTGMGSDGTLGLRLLKRHGCFIIAQDEASCVVYGMPKAAVEAGIVDVVQPLDAIAAGIVAALRSGGA